MMKDYMEIDGSRYRVVCNMSAIESFAQSQGWKTIEELTNLANMGVGDLATLIHCCIVEGENLEGRAFIKTVDELKRIATLKEMKDFMLIFKNQCAVDCEGEESKKKQM